MAERRRLCWWPILLGCLMLGCQPATEDRLGAFTGDALRGRVLADDFGCGACHYIPRVPGARGEVGPNLQQISRRGYIAGRVANTEDNMVHWLLDPESVAPGTAMPDVGLDPDQARDIAAFLHQLQ